MIPVLLWFDLRSRSSGVPFTKGMTNDQLLCFRSCDKKKSTKCRWLECAKPTRHCSRSRPHHSTFSYRPALLQIPRTFGPPTTTTPNTTVATMKCSALAVSFLVTIGTVGAASGGNLRRRAQMADGCADGTWECAPAADQVASYGNWVWKNGSPVEQVYARKPQCLNGTFHFPTFPAFSSAPHSSAHSIC